MSDNSNEWLNKIIEGNSKQIIEKMPDEFVDCIITSPPYFGLRDYGVDGQIGLEDTPEKYIERLMGVFSECKRVLKKTGTFWLNIGDTYASSGSEKFDKRSYGGLATSHDTTILGRGRVKNYQPKCLLMMPERIAMSLIDDGWILRNKIIWYKSNAMPSSVKDRFSNKWEYMYFFTKNNDSVYWINNKDGRLITEQPKGINGIEGIDWEWVEHSACEGKGCDNKRCVDGKVKSSFWEGKDYWFDLDAVRQPHTESSIKRIMGYHDGQFQSGKTWDYKKQLPMSGGGDDRNIPRILKGLKKQYQGKFQDMPHFKSISERKNYQRQILGVPHDLATSHPLGGNPGDLWSITTQPFKDVHFAVFPEKLCETPIKAGCPAEACRMCGKPRERIIEKGDLVRTGEGHISYGYKGGSKHQQVKKSDVSSWSQNFVKDNLIPGMAYERKTVGWSDCQCKTPKDGKKYVPGIVLDPFCGSGTALVVAKKHGRNYIGIDLKEDYCNMARKRLSKVDEKLKIWGVKV